MNYDRCVRYVDRNLSDGTQKAPPGRAAFQPRAPPFSACLIFRNISIATGYLRATMRQSTLLIRSQSDPTSRVSNRKNNIPDSGSRSPVLVHWPAVRSRRFGLAVAIRSARPRPWLSVRRNRVAGDGCAWHMLDMAARRSGMERRRWTRLNANPNPTPRRTQLHDAEAMDAQPTCP